jgi:hypothetical protein
MSRLHVVVTSLRLLRASFTRNAPPPPKKKMQNPCRYSTSTYRIDNNRGGGQKKGVVLAAQLAL